MSSDFEFRRDAWPPLRHFVGGYCSGIALVLAGHPFDTVKVRLQTEGRGGRFRGPVHCVRDTVAREGLLALYKGVTPPLFATGVINAMLWGSQGVVVRQLHGGGVGPPEISTIMAAAVRRSLLVSACGLACLTRERDTHERARTQVVTGFCISFVVTPMEGIKARLQVQYAARGGVSRYAGPVDCARQVTAALGVRRGIYRGWVPTALCRMSNWSYFGAYEYLRRRLVASGDSGKLSPLASMAAGAGAGVAYWLSCYPVDLLKNRIQACVCAVTCVCIVGGGGAGCHTTPPCRPFVARTLASANACL